MTGFLDAVRAKVRRARHPLVTITDPPDGIVFERDVEVPVRDGTILRVNVFRPAGPGRYPVILSTHPYGKDGMPRRTRRGYTIPRQYRMLYQDAPFSHSAWTGWEAPDPAFWVPRGYAVVNADLRGWGHSDGIGELFSAQEGEDCHDLVEWAADREWSTGRVGMSGVSYLAITQWRTAATNPPHLAAIMPWEGLTDLYRDFAMPGGIREDGFSVMWNTMLSAARRRRAGLRPQIKHRPTIDAWWDARNPHLEDITVPALVCASFSDQSLHTRGSFEGFRRIASTEKWLYTHRGPKWATYYSPEALAVQARFFDRFLRQEAVDLDPEPVRVEVRSDRATIADVFGAASWPPPEVRAVTLHADAVSGRLVPADAALRDARIDLRSGTTRFEHRFEHTTDLVGPMRLRTTVSVAGGDLTLFVVVRKYREDLEVGFEGSYGLIRDAVTHGWLRASLAGTDDTRTTVWEPYHPFDERRPVPDREAVVLDLALLPSATRFDAGDTLVLELRDSWPFPGNPVTGGFPARYARTRPRLWSVHTGPEHPTTLTVPVRPVHRTEPERLPLASQ